MVQNRTLGLNCTMSSCYRETTRRDKRQESTNLGKGQFGLDPAASPRGERTWHLACRTATSSPLARLRLRHNLRICSHRRRCRSRRQCLQDRRHALCVPREARSSPPAVDAHLDGLRSRIGRICGRFRGRFGPNFAGEIRILIILKIMFSVPVAYSGSRRDCYENESVHLRPFISPFVSRSRSRASQRLLALERPSSLSMF